MRIAKWTLLILGGLVLLAVATVFVLTSVVDPNRYRGKIASIVTDLVGRPFVIEGNLAITWYPWLGMKTGAAHLDNPPGMAGPPLVEWQSITVAAKVWPLLQGEVVADRVLLQGPVVHLRRDAQGRGNWEGLGGGQGASAGSGMATQAGATNAAKAGAPDVAQASGAPDVAQASAPDAAQAGSPGATSARGSTGGAGAGGPTGGRTPAAGRTTPTRPLQIAGIEIRDGTIDYVDEASGQHATLSNLVLDVGEWRAGKPLPVHTRFLAHAGPLPPAGVWVQLDASELAIQPTPLKVGAPKLTLKVANAQLDGDVSYEQTADTHVHAHGSAVLRSPSLRKLANDLALNQTLPHDPTTLGPLELTTSWRYDDGAIAAKPLALKLDEISFTGWLRKSAAPEATWAFELHGDRIDLGRYVNIDSANKKPFELPVAALKAINANGRLIFDQVVLADTHMADVRLELQTPEGKQ